MSPIQRIACLFVCSIASLAFSGIPGLGWLWAFAGLLAAIYCEIERQNDLTAEVKKS